MDRYVFRLLLEIQNAGWIERFPDLIDRLRPTCLKQATKLLGDEHLAQDCFQELLNKLWLHPHRYKALQHHCLDDVERHAWGFLRTILENICIDKRKRDGPPCRSLEDLLNKGFDPASADLPVPEQVPDYHLNAKELAGLLEVDRRTINRWRREGLPHEERGDVYYFDPDLTLIWRGKPTPGPRR